MKKKIKKHVNTIHRQLRIMLVNFFKVIGLSWGLDQKRNGTELILADHTDVWTIGERMMMKFSEYGHPIFRASSAFEN